MKNKKLALLLAAAMSVSLLAGCGGGSDKSTNQTQPAAQESQTAQAPEAAGTETEESQETGPKRDSVTIALATDVSSLNPYGQDNNVTNQVMFHVYEPLVTQDRDLSIIPCLADSWEESEDGMTWTFKLHEGVKFHDGSDFTSEDVVASYDYAREPGSSYNSRFTSVESVEAVDDYTVVIHMKNKYPLLLTDLAMVCISNKENIEGKTPEEVGSSVIGTGRYKLVEHVKEDHIDMVANEEYWGGAPEIKSVRFRPISNAATRTATMLSGELDVMGGVSVQDVERLEATEGIHVVSEPSMEMIYMNMEQMLDDNPAVEGGGNPLKDVRVRQAMYQAIDTDMIINNVMQGHAYPTATLIRDTFNGYSPELERFPYDPEAAKALLAEAGYPDGFTITLDAGSDITVNSSEVAQAVAGYLEKVGIKVNLNLMPSATFLPHIRPYEHKTGLLISAWSVYTGEGITMMNQHCYTYDQEKGTGNANRGHYSNPEVDKLISEAMQESDKERRAELTKQIDKMTHDDVAYIPLYVQENIFAVKDDIDYTPRFNKYIFAWEISVK
ncbi:MAG: ABC transporter substrate-binding protein [Lachnospiraceae bacterium]|nr:ABC transporter substrate-binding protein [Lachnospiraceae bacterium]